MPSVYAHYRFGAAMLAKMPGDIRLPVQRSRRLFDIGLHGPDLFFYATPLLSAQTKALGQKLHRLTGRDFFARMSRCARLERSEAYSAYLYGLLCHYCLDAALHALIDELTTDSGSHLRMEAEFDRFLLEMDGKTPACAQDLSPHMELKHREYEIVAKFYTGITDKDIRECLRNMAAITKVCAVAPGKRRTVIAKLTGTDGKTPLKVMIPAEPDPDYSRLDPVLLQLYEEAEQRFPEMLLQLYSHMTYNAPLEKEFDPIFG